MRKAEKNGCCNGCFPWLLSWEHGSMSVQSQAIEMRRLYQFKNNFYTFYTHILYLDILKKKILKNKLKYTIQK